MLNGGITLAPVIAGFSVKFFGSDFTETESLRPKEGRL
jgi:hypothetical protein